MKRRVITKAVVGTKACSALGALLLAAGGLLLAGCGSDGGRAGDDAGSDGAGARAGSSSTGSGASGGSDSGSGGSGEGGGGSGGTGGSSNIDENLDEYSEAAFGYVDQRPADFHPLDGRESRLLRREETAIVALSGSGALAGASLDDAEHAFAALAATPGGELGGFTPLDMVSANVDDDGNDELVSVGLNGTSLVLRVVDSEGSELFGSSDGFSQDDASYKFAALRAQDSDDDGRAEILIAAVTATGVSLRLYDDAEHGYALLKDVYSGPGEEIAAVFANLDDDRRPEIAALIDAGSDLERRVFDDSASEYASLGLVQNEDLGIVDAPFVVTGLRLEAGDFDHNLRDLDDEPVGDARDELAAFVDGYFVDGDDGNPGIRAGYWDDAEASFAEVEVAARSDFGEVHPSSSYRYTHDWGFRTLSADSNGDGQDELYFLARQAGDTNFDWALYHLSFGAEAGEWDSATEIITVADEIAGKSPVFMSAVAGRTDSLGSDVLIAVNDGGTVRPYRVFSDNSDTPYQSDIAPLPTFSAPNGKAVWVAGGDYDADSLRIRFTGSKWLQLTRPQPIAIVAAAPAKDGISQNYDETTTAYGTAVTGGNESTEEYGVSNKLTLSFEISVPVLDFLSAGAEVELERQFTRSQTTTSLVRNGTSYGGAYPDDVVVFNGTLCMRYEYEVLGGGDQDVVGTRMTIDEPLDSRIYKWTVGYYDLSLRDEASPIGEDILSHTAGDPASYPTTQRRNQLMKQNGVRLANSWATPAAASVGQGGGSRSLSISVSEEHTTTDTLTLSTSYSGGFSAFVGASYTQGYDETEAYSVTVGTETEYEGTVGDIASADDYEQWFYSFGLFVYPTTLAGGESVQVVDFWTEGLGPGYQK
jgi:hypothetical protein